MQKYSKHWSSAYKDNLPTMQEFEKRHTVGQYAVKGHNIANWNLYSVSTKSHLTLASEKKFLFTIIDSNSIAIITFITLQ